MSIDVLYYVILYYVSCFAWTSARVPAAFATANGDPNKIPQNTLNIIPQTSLFLKVGNGTSTQDTSPTHPIRAYSRSSYTHTCVSGRNPCVCWRKTILVLNNGRVSVIWVLGRVWMTCMTDLAFSRTCCCVLDMTVRCVKVRFYLL